MSAVTKPRITAADYLAIERRAEFKSEFYEGEMFAMAGASREHNRIKENMVGELFAQLKGGPYQTFSERLVRQADGSWGLVSFEGLPPRWNSLPLPPASLLLTSTPESRFPNFRIGNPLR
jgi:Uma2 family endonuclease